MLGPCLPVRLAGCLLWGVCQWADHAGCWRTGLPAIWACPTACLQAAAVRVIEAQQSVARLVQQRWEAAGADRAAWPLAAQVRHWRLNAELGLIATVLCHEAAALPLPGCLTVRPCWLSACCVQEEIENVEARLGALMAALKDAQAQAAEASAAAESHRGARVVAEDSAARHQREAARQQREHEQRTQRAEAAASAAAVQVAEFREALAAAERERDQLLAEKGQRERASREAAAAVAAARRRTGSGSLQSLDMDAAAAVQQQLQGQAGLGNGSSGGGRRHSLQPGGDAPPSPLPAVKQRDVLETTDVLYLKNVVLKFIDAHIR